MKRLIGSYTGTAQETLVIAIAAMHGNEPAGMYALRDLFQMLHDEIKSNPNFKFKGKIVGLMGNIQAFERKLRFVKQDLNRMITLENIEKLTAIHHAPKGNWVAKADLAYEDLELVELIQGIEHEIKTYQPTRVIVLDLHTTSATGGIFTIIGEDKDSLDIALSLYAPIVKGFVRGVGGSSLHYFNVQNMGVPTIALAFEAGQHNEAQSTQRAIAWLVNCLRAVGCIQKDDVDNKHEHILRGYAKSLPKAVELIFIYKITTKDTFKMQPNYTNFQQVKKGEILAYNSGEAVICPEDCMILMPLYQNKGADGFFLVKSIL
jgi:succinylglutamate desuccinylase